MKVGDRLYCHTKMTNSNNWITKGRSYEISEILHNHLYIIDNDGDRNVFLFKNKHKKEEKHIYHYFTTLQEQRKQKLNKIYDSKI